MLEVETSQHKAKLNLQYLQSLKPDQDFGVFKADGENTQRMCGMTQVSVLDLWVVSVSGEAQQQGFSDAEWPRATQLSITAIPKSWHRDCWHSPGSCWGSFTVGHSRSFAGTAFQSGSWI